MIRVCIFMLVFINIFTKKWFTIIIFSRNIIRASDDFIPFYYGKNI